MGMWETSIAKNAKGNCHSDSISTIELFEIFHSVWEKFFNMLFPYHFCDKCTHLDNDAINYILCYASHFSDSVVVIPSCQFI